MNGTALFDPSPTLALGARAAALREAGQDVLSLSTPTFPCSAAAVTIPPSAALLSEAEGSRDLRELARTRLFRGWSLPQHAVIVTAGVKAGLHAILRHLLSPGERVGIVTPAWPSYAQLVGLLYGQPVPIETRMADGWTLDPAAILAAARAPGRPLRALLLSNPSNPTGRVLGRDALDVVLDTCSEAGIACVLDESFSLFRFDGAREETERPAPRRPGALYVVNSFSKNFAVQGYRLGAVMAPQDSWKPVLAAHQGVSSSASSAAQAAVLALRDAGLLVTQELSQQREATLAFIAAAEWDCHPTEGGFYAYPRLPDAALIERFERAGLLALTGAAFGGDPLHLRLCFARPMAELEVMLGRMRGVL